MGVTKQYLRVAPGPVFGVVASQKANILTLPGSKDHSSLCAVGACENVLIWDLTTKQKLATLEGEKWEVTALAESPSSNHLAVGYSNGSIKIFQLDSGQSDVTFQGHKSAVTCLAYDKPGLRLVSGAKDTDVILWDIVSEAGLFRLKGHKKEITQAAFLKHRDVVVTSSKDAYIKFWDVSTQHCFYTVVGHRSEVYGFLLLRDEMRLVSGSADSELRVWDIQYLDTKESENNEEEDPPKKKMKLASEESSMDVDGDSGSGTEDEEEKAEDESMKILTCKKIGSVMRQGRERLVTLCTDPQEKMLLCHGPDKHLEIFELPSSDDLNKLKAKRVKKLRKKHLDTGEEVDTTNVHLKLEDEMKFLERFKFSAKLWSVHCCLETSKDLRGYASLPTINISYRILDLDFSLFTVTARIDVLCNDNEFCALLSDNKIESGTLMLDKHKVEMGTVVPVSQSGHRSVVRTLSFSADNATILSASAEEVKVWNRDSLQCTRTIACDYALCSMFVSGDRHAIIGTKTGKLQLFDLNEGSCLESCDAHEGAVWSVAPMPDQRGLLSGGADHDLKFWNYELVADTTLGAKHKVLTLEHTRTLKMDEDILCVKFTPNHKLIAVALLDSTVKIFFADTLKFFLSLYGHKLPVTCMDISTDSTLIVTGSADRNIKIWGLDFGDCHKSIFAHDESVTCIQFIPKTHMFVSGGKDRKVKHWDADNFENIQTLEGHQGEVRSLSVSPTGGTVVTSSQDKSLRLWERTEEPLVLEEEREMEREKEEEEAILKDGEEVVPGETTEEVKMAGKKTLDTVKGTERIMEALEIHENQVEEQNQAKLAKLPPPTPHPMMLAYQSRSPEEFVIETLRRIRASELNGSLLSLPFSYVTKLLPILDFGLINKRETELVCRCLNFLLRIHHGEITSNHGNLPIIARLKQHSVDAVKQHRDLTAFNAAGLSFLSKLVAETSGVMMFADATVKRKKKKRAVLVRK